MYLNKREEFDSTAKFWTESYAKKKDQGCKDDLVAKVCEMGFSKEDARRALEKCDWDESAAVNRLLGM